MATDEAGFKSEFKKSLQAEYPDALIWTNTDLIRSGLPDFSVLHHGLFMAVEAKFVKELPKKKTSLVLSHVVSESQRLFLEGVKKNGQSAIVLIGTANAAVVMREIKNNYTLEEVLGAPRITKAKGVWQTKGFLDGRQ